MSLPKTLINPTFRYLVKFTGKPANKSSIYNSFQEKLKELSIDEKVQRELLLEVEKAIDESVIAGYKILEERLITQKENAKNETGVGNLPNGTDYYQFLLLRISGSDISIENLYNRCIEDLNNIQIEMKQVFDSLGYDSNLNVEDLYSLLENNDSTLDGEGLLNYHRNLIIDSKKWMENYFFKIHIEDLLVSDDSKGGFYMASSEKQSRIATFYTNTDESYYYTLPTSTLHETYPGHHYQMALQKSYNLPYFQDLETTSGYKEGWATYAEYLMNEIGFYDNDPIGKLGYLKSKAISVVGALCDMGLHLENWSLSQAAKYLSENTGLSRDVSYYYVSQYLASPAVISSYHIGFIEFKSIEGLS